jgi:hypothetical protein
MELSMFGVEIKRANIDTIRAKCGDTEIMKGESLYLLRRIALRGPPIRLGWTVRIDLDHFWRWSAEYHNQIRCGIPLWYRGTEPRNFQSQKKEKDPEIRHIMGAKLMKVFARRYLLYGMILSLTSFLKSRRRAQTSVWCIMGPLLE